LVPAECDLRGMPYMALELVRLFDSDFYALSNGDEFKAGVSLWAKAFLQVPAGSLPDDDRILAHLSGAGSNWLAVKDMALHGWFKCGDGRLYHHTVAEKVLEAWKCRRERFARTEAARAARAANRNNQPTEPPVKVVADTSAHNQSSATLDVTNSVTGSKRREENGREENGSKKGKKDQPLATLAPSADAEAVCDFEEFWQRYPRKVSKGHARRAFEAAVKRVAAEVIIAALDRAVFNPDPRYIPHPATWLNGERWRDEVDDFDPVLRAVGLTPEDFLDLPPGGRLQ
jgi:hypothetical protein